MQKKRKLKIKKINALILLCYILANIIILRYAFITQPKEIKSLGQEINLLQIEKTEIKNELIKLKVDSGDIDYNDNVQVATYTNSINQKAKLETVNHKQENITQYENIKVCSNSPTKSYMDGWKITSPSSPQYQLLHSGAVYVNDKGMFVLTHNDVEYIGVALSQYFGKVGDKFRITLDSGIVMNVFKLDQKKQNELTDGLCTHPDGSVIEMVIDTNVAQDYYGVGGNGYILNGNFNNSEEYKGSIEKIERVIE